MSASLTFDNQNNKDAIQIAKIDAPDNKNLHNKYLYVTFHIADEKKVVEELPLKKGTFVPIPYLEKGQRSAIYISGGSGSGKSVFACKIIQQLWTLLPKQKIEKHKSVVLKPAPIFYFSAKDVDESLHEISQDKDVFFKIDIESQDFLRLTWKDIEENSICLFDDWNIIRRNKLAHAHIVNFVKELLELSRSKNIQIVIVNHQTTDYHKTRDIIFECDTYILFPQTNLNATKKFLLSYGEMDKNEVQDILKQKYGKYTFCAFHKKIPRYYIMNQKIKLL